MSSINQETVNVTVYYLVPSSGGFAPRQDSYVTAVNSESTDKQIVDYFKQNHCKINLGRDTEDLVVPVVGLFVTRSSLDGISRTAYDLREEG